MKIICTQENLKTGLSVVGRIISNSNTLPILNNLLLKTENGLLKVSATNLEIAITNSIRCKIEEEGSVTVSSKTLIDLVNSLPNKNISIESRENSLFVEAENYHTNIKTLPADEFPLIPEVEGQTELLINSQEIKTALDQVVFAASTNQTQPEISGILFAGDGQNIRIAATDRYRLAEKTLSLPKPFGAITEVIIPQKTCVEISRIIGNQKGDVELRFSETQVAVSFNETQIISRLVDGQYPDYRQIIPTSFQATAVAEKSALVSALRAAAVFGHNSNSVNVEFFQDKQQMVLTAESSDLGKSSVEIPTKIEGSGGSLVLNYHYLLDCLNGLDSANVVIKMTDDNSPSLVVPEDKKDYIYLVMPIKS
jgi:DNA polymerase III subunit beta